MIDKYRQPESSIDHQDLGLEVEYVNPNEVHLLDVDDRFSAAVDQAVIGSAYVNDIMFARRHKISQDKIKSTLDSHLEMARNDLSKVTRRVPEHVEAIGGYYLRQMPEDLTDKLELDDARSVLGKLGDLSNDKLGEFLLWNAENMNKIAENKQSELDQIKKEFGKLFHTAITNGLPLSEEQLTSRLTDSRLISADPVGMVVNSIDGSIDSQRRLIRISAARSPEKTRETAFHELAHLIGGNTIKREVGKEAPEDEGSVSYRVERSGLAGKEIDKNAPEWIREAVDEQLVRLITLNMPEDFRSITKDEFFSVKEGIYNRNREALQFILEDEDIYPLLEANFENATFENQGVLEKTQSFWEKIEQRFGPQIHQLIGLYERFDSDEELGDFKSRLISLKFQRQLTKHLKNLT